MNKNTKLVYGVGINDVDYRVKLYERVDGKQKIIWECPYYRKWYSMLSRCYSKGVLEKRPTYKGCKVCDEWLLFSNFRKWMIQQEWEGRCLDKDFLVEGNKVYSPSTCVFLPSKLNSFITTCGKVRGHYPLGVDYKKKHKEMVNELSKPYRSMISGQTGRVTLGHYLTPEEAHQVYLKAKLRYCEDYLLEFKTEPLIIKGLTGIRDKLRYHIDTNTELVSF